jgi:Zn-dependent protease/CBS domain-containing protein
VWNDRRGEGGKGEGRAPLFGRGFKLFSLFGFPIRIDLSWFLIAFLIAWSLAAGLFPAYYPQLSRGTYWAMGVIGALALFACVVLHELGHALMARRYGIQMKGITLFVFGGVAEMSDEPPSAGAEFAVAVAGPVVSIVLAGLFYLVAMVVEPVAAYGVVAYLAWINAILVAFNLVPAFPLDGGRVLRAVLWHWKQNLLWATGITARIGAGFGLAMMILAVFSLFTGNFIGAIWWFLLGMFLRSAAQMSYQQVVWRQFLSGTKVRGLMNTEPKTVGPEVTVDRFVDDYIYRYHHKMFPATVNGGLLGCVGIHDVKDLPREQWAEHTVGELVHPCTEENTIDQNADAVTALQRMNQTGSTRLMVVDGERLVGVISLRDMLSYLSRRMELESDQIVRV